MADTAPVHPIRALRERLGLPQRKFATLCGVTQLTVVLAESGRISEPRKLLHAIDRLGLHRDVGELRRESRQWVAEDSARLADELGLRDRDRAAVLERLVPMNPDSVRLGMLCVTRRKEHSREVQP